ncbi:MAG: carboxypeptidase regulatory-like domain-containing protein [Planctomycetaceae bacterium]
MRTLLLLAAAVVAAVVILLSARDDGSRRASSTGDAPARDPAPAPPPTSTESELPLWLGRVTDAEGDAVAGATVIARDAMAGQDWLAGEERGRAQSGENGRFALRAKGGGVLVAEVHHPDYERGGGWLEPTIENVVVLRRGARVTLLVRAPDQSPLPGAKVSGATVRRSATWRYTESSVETVTDAEGRALLGGQPEGEFEVRVAHPRYAPQLLTLAVDGLTPLERVVVLEEGGRVAGRVLAPSGDPVAGARVQIMGDARHATVSEADGSYLLTAVGEEGTLLAAEAEGYGPGFFGEELGWGEAVPVQVKSGQTVRGIDIRLTLPSLVTGRLLDATDYPLAGVTVSFVCYGGLVVGGPSVTDAGGRFVSAPAALKKPASFHLRFGAPGHTLPEVEGESLAPGERRDLGDLRAVALGRVRGQVLLLDGSPAGGGWVFGGGARGLIGAKGSFDLQGVKPGEVILTAGIAGSAEGAEAKVRFEVRVTLEPGATLEGVVLRALPSLAIRGRVISSKGEPRAYAHVCCVPASAQPPYNLDECASAGSREDGTFEIRGLAEGEYAVGLAGQWPAFAELPAPVRVRAGGPEIELVLPAKGAVVQGKVLARLDGRPVRAFTATFLRTAFLFPEAEDWEEFENADGSFRYAIEEPGGWAVEITARGYASLRTESFKLREGETRDLGEIRLGDAGRIAGRVLDAAGAPVPFARIHVLSPKFETNWEAPFTDIDGRFTAAGIAPGVYTLFAVSPRHPIGMVAGVTVEEGATARADVQFAPAAPLRVTVLDEGGRPVEGADFSYTFKAVMGISSRMFRGYEPPGFGAHTTGPDGTLDKPSLPPGEVTVTIQAEGFQPESRVLQLEAGSRNQLEIRLTRER